MPEVCGVGLIQMNAHFVRQGWAVNLAIWGAVLCVAMGLCLFAALANRKRRRAAVFGALLAVGIALVVIGLCQPRINQIQACAVGPVSLETVASYYRIIKIDGSMLTLVAR